MKKVTLFLAVMMMAITAMAQQKVAILETVDKAQNVNYGVKLLLRSSLTSAISNTPGYEGYDRVDMASIAGEQEFQRTGNVSDSQIKQLGVATGASYVLVAEAAKYDASSIIITAKLLDVETFGVKNSAVVVSGVSADEMKESCEVLAAQLLKTPLPKGKKTTKTSAEQSQTIVDVSFPTENNNSTATTVQDTDCPNKTLAGVLNIVLGSLGVGHFYTSQTTRGIFDILFCWTGIPAIIGIVEGVIWLCDSDGKWHARCVKWKK